MRLPHLSWGPPGTTRNALLLAVAAWIGLLLLASAAVVHDLAMPSRTEKLSLVLDLRAVLNEAADEAADERGAARDAPLPDLALEGAPAGFREDEARRIANPAPIFSFPEKAEAPPLPGDAVSSTLSHPEGGGNAPGTPIPFTDLDAAIRRILLTHPPNRAP